MKNVLTAAGFATLTVLLTNSVWAGEARHCIKVEQVNDNGREMTALKNACPEKVYVRWCYDGADDGACKGEKFYNRSTSIDKDDFHTSRYGLPTGPEIHFAACFNKSPHVFRDALGAYTCKPVVKCAGSAKPVVFSRIDKGGNHGTAIYQVQRGGNTHTFELDKTAFKDIPPEELENATKLRICMTAAGIEDLEEANFNLLQYFKTKLKYDEDVCANTKPQPEHCKKNRSLGRRG